MTNLPDRTRLQDSWASGGARGPGRRRLALGGFLLAIQGVGAAGSLILFALQGSTAAQRLFGFSSPSIVVCLVELTLAILSMVGGAGLWLGRSSVVGLCATVAWVALYAWIGFADGIYSVSLEVGLLLLILSGAWARRGAGGRPRDLLLRGR